MSFFLKLKFDHALIDARVQGLNRPYTDKDIGEENIHIPIIFPLNTAHNDFLLNKII